MDKNSANECTFASIHVYNTTEIVSSTRASHHTESLNSVNYQALRDREIDFFSSCESRLQVAHIERHRKKNLHLPALSLRDFVFFSL